MCIMLLFYSLYYCYIIDFHLAIKFNLEFNVGREVLTIVIIVITMQKLTHYDLLLNLFSLPRCE